MRKLDKKFVLAAAQTAFVFGLAAWAYVVAMQLSNPDSVTWPLAWWLPIRMDYFAEIAFIISAAGFFVWRLKS